jgi:hypothetical protein
MRSQCSLEVDVVCMLPVSSMEKVAMMSKHIVVYFVVVPGSACRDKLLRCCMNDANVGKNASANLLCNYFSSFLNTA